MHFLMLIIVKMKFHCQETTKRELERNPFYIGTETILILWWLISNSSEYKNSAILSKGR